MTPESDTPAPPLDLIPGRRTFFGWITYGVAAAAAAVLGWPVVRYFLGTAPARGGWVTLGPVDSFRPDETRMVTFENPIRQPWDGKTSHTGVFVRFRGKEAEPQDQFLILAVNCTHLGCPVTWFPQSGLFLCPCHGGVYSADGERASGPPPRGLYRCVWRIERGQLEVQAPHYPTLQDPLDPKDTAAAASTRCRHA